MCVFVNDLRVRLCVCERGSHTQRATRRIVPPVSHAYLASLDKNLVSLSLRGEVDASWFARPVAF